MLPPYFFFTFFSFLPALLPINFSLRSRFSLPFVFLSISATAFLFVNCLHFFFHSFAFGCGIDWPFIYGHTQTQRTQNQAKGDESCAHSHGKQVDRCIRYIIYACLRTFERKKSEIAGHLENCQRLQKKCRKFTTNCGAHLTI